MGGKTKILGGQKVVKSDKCLCVSQLLGVCARAAPKVYAYGSQRIHMWHLIKKIDRQMTKIKRDRQAVLRARTGSDGVSVA